MRKMTELPAQFSELVGKVNYISQVGHNEYCGSCPECGGAPHQDGSFPDRFRLIITSKATGGPLGWCRRCNYKWFPGKGQGKDFRPDPAVLQTWENERRAAEERRLHETQHALALLNKEKAWLKFHDLLNDHPEIKDIWKNRGINDPYWLGYWELGYCREFEVFYKEGENWLKYVSDSLTIPIFAPDNGPCVSLRHRLLHPQRPEDRYRPACKGLAPSPFICDRDRPMEGPLLIVEGEIKAMVSYLCLDDPKLHVVGLPGKSPDLEIMAKFANCSPVYLLLDPDAYFLTPDERKQGKSVTAASRLTQEIGKDRVRLINLPDKVDDLITAGVIKKPEFKRLLQQARRAW